jgi:hypothetical protein
MHKARVASRFVSVLFLLLAVCALLSACGSSGDVPCTVRNDTGSDVTIAISLLQNGRSTSLLRGYVLSNGSETHVSVPRNILSSNLQLSVTDANSICYVYRDLPTQSIGTSASISLCYQDDQLVLLVDPGNGSVTTVQPSPSAKTQSQEFLLRVKRGEATYAEYYAQDFWLNLTGSNDRKTALIYGSNKERSYATQSEAAAQMVSVTVPVWKLSGGKKVSSTFTISVNASLADEILEIFTEIYNDPEQFPIKDLGGYSWRGASSTSEHNQGTAIDINYNENFQIRYGKVVVGSFWNPDESEYSIPENGSVVRIFEEHGWLWGGNAWAGDTDYSKGNHDYMHFSYFGR